MGPLSRVQPDTGFEQLVAGRGRDLMRTAWLLTGDWQLAEDLVQSALEATWAHWDRVERRDAPELYVRRVILTTWLRWRRRRWFGEVPTEILPDSGGGPAELLDERVTVLRALARLTPRQRAVIVTRFFDDLTESQTAAALGCSLGTVKAQTAKALTTLRALPELSALLTEGTVS